MNLSLHPLFVGWFFVLTLFASNIDVLTLPELSLPLLAATAVSFSLTALLYLVIRNIRKASIASTIILMMMFSYGYLYDFLLSVSWLSIVAHHKILAPLLTILTGLLLWKTIKSKSDMKNATQILNVTGIALLCMPLITCSPMLLKRAEKASRYDMGDNQIETLAVSGSVPERDIIFIILDKYGSNATLQRVYGYDNS